MSTAVRRSPYGVPRLELSRSFAVRGTAYAERNSIPPFLRILFLLLLAACDPASPAESFAGTCVKVLDGDSIIVRTSDGNLEVRLEGIDAPEHGQDFGEEAKAEARRLALDKKVRGEVRRIDEYGRSVARVYVEGQDLGLMLVKAGAAWKYKYSNDFLLASAEKEARRTKRGLWALPNPVQPWKWRKQHPLL
jgi:endonuclease YncB( thermonuclease family)